MADFDLLSFTLQLKTLFLESKSFPYMQGIYSMDTAWSKQTSDKKHPNRRPAHLKDEMSNVMARTQIIGENTITFDIGDSNMELNYPHYHILQNSYSIRKRNKGTEKSKGSQAHVMNRAKRDYEIVQWNGKTFTKEYSRNVRGARKPQNIMMYGGNFIVNREANAYQNIHYHYIDKILDNDVVEQLGALYNMKTMRKQNTGLEDELAMQLNTDVDTILEIFRSFD